MIKEKKGTRALTLGYNIKIVKSKRSVSAVVATVLLVLITFMAVGIVWLFIKPMVENNLQEGSSCFELRDQAELSQGEYTYYNSTETSLVVKRGFKDIDINGFRVGISFGADAESYDLIDKESSMGKVIMSNGSDIIELPVPGGAKNYIFKKGNGTSIDLAIISKTGSVCSMGSYSIPEQMI